MFKQIMLLTKLEMYNFWGINVLLHTRDKKEKRKSVLLAVLYSFVVVLLIGYVCGLCYGLEQMGVPEVIPAYLIIITTLLTLFFSIFKAGGIIFRKKGYEILSSMPLSDKVLVCSRFMRLYLENLAFTALVLLPGLVMYAVYCRPDWSAFPFGILSILVVPLIPVSISAGAGALIMGISSRMKHRAWVEAGLSILLVCGMLMVPNFLPENVVEITPEMLKSYGDMVLGIFGALYPPAVWLGDAIGEGSIGKLLLAAVTSLALLGMVIWIVGAKFHGICRLLFSTSAKHEYQKVQLQKNSVLKALVVREGRRYFSSGVYVTNTIMGPLLAVVMSVSFFFVDLEEMVATAPMELNVRAALPFLLATTFTMMSVTSVSISMEGKEIWILKSLPLSRKEILDSKILFQLCLTAPFYVVSVIVGSLALKLQIIELMGMILIPVVFIVFSAVYGITINLLLPKMQWDSEVAVVKQSASAMIGGLGGALVGLGCTVLVLFIPRSYMVIAYVVIAFVLVLVTGVLYQKNRSIRA